MQAVGSWSTKMKWRIFSKRVNFVWARLRFLYHTSLLSQLTSTVVRTPFLKGVPSQNYFNICRPAFGGAVGRGLMYCIYGYNSHWRLNYQIAIIAAKVSFRATCSKSLCCLVVFELRRIELRSGHATSWKHRSLLNSTSCLLLSKGINATHFSD